MNQMPEKNSQAFPLPLIIGVVLLLVLGVVGYFKWQQSKIIVPPRLNEKLLTDAFIQAAEEVHKRFKLGDKEEHLKQNPEACVLELGNLNNVSSSYTRCNADYLDCFYKTNKNPIEVELNGKTYKFTLGSFASGKFYRSISRAVSAGTFLPQFGTQIELKSKEYPEFTMQFVFEDSCRDVFLPRRKYAYAEEVKTEILEWDNFDQNIFVDRFLVSNRDVREWVDATGKIVNFDKENLALPAYALKLAEMKEYCAFRGKNLLSAEVFDAASFLPTDREMREPVKVKRGPYYWTKDSKQTFLAKKDKSLVNAENCSYAFIKNCNGIVPYDPYYLNPSWMGMNQMLGGPLEALDNPLEPLKNLKASSYYFDLKSSWHVLGKRANWSGEGHELKDFDFGKESPSKEEGVLNVAFRCMVRAPFILKETDEDI